MRLHYGRPDGVDFGLLVQQMPDSEFSKPSRSTIPLLSYWKDAPRAIELVCDKAFGVRPPSDGDLCFEYPVKSVGRSKASFTDVMFVASDLAFAIEGKSLEPMYCKVSEWLSDGGNSSNQRNVLDRWIKLIREQTDTPHEPPIADLVYQMVHRTASVCSLRRRRCCVVYQVFAIGEYSSDYETELRKLAMAFGTDGKLGIFVHHVATRRTESYAALKRALAVAEVRRKPFILRDAVLDGNLFEFQEGEFVVISRPTGVDQSIGIS